MDFVDKDESLQVDLKLNRPLSVTKRYKAGVQLVWFYMGIMGILGSV